MTPTKAEPKFGLSPKTLKLLRSVFLKHIDIERVIVYGSRAMGTFRPGSDIDLALVAPSFGLTELMRVEREIDDLMLPYKVDLLLHHKIDNESLRAHIDRVGVGFE